MNRTALKNKRILLGITGSVAAYKSADLARRFVESGAQVTCVMTDAAQRFITPLTLGALTHERVFTDLFDAGGWNMSHLALAQVEAVVVAPCSADFLSALAQGRADSLLSALCLATRARVLLAPAMHEPMWTHPATQKNVGLCRDYGYQFIGPEKGSLASGEGIGRMADPSNIVAGVIALLPQET